MQQTKPFCISKMEIWNAYLIVKKNKGGAGVDNKSLEAFNNDLKDNLFKIWNRMSSGSYFPPAVLNVNIPKSNNKFRTLGIPTVGDRIAQTVVKERIEPRFEEIFHEDSYGYRPEKSQIQAVKKTRERCWKNSWVVDIDIKGFFDNINHELLMRAVNKHITEKWLLLYIKRWLVVPGQTREGNITERNKGIPQGGVVSPLLANLFLHYSFDKWMTNNHPRIWFERYADDIILHCRSEKQAYYILGQIIERLRICKLEVNKEKTKIVYCKDKNRKDNHQNIKFNFLGFTFKQRKSKDRWGNKLMRFNPAISEKAKNDIFEKLRRYAISRRLDKSLEEIAEYLNPKIRGWINYYGQFYKSELNYLFYQLNLKLLKWVKRKYKKFKTSWKRAKKWFKRVIQKEPSKFAHWKKGFVL